MTGTARSRDDEEPPREIERKFLLSAIPPAVHDVAPVRIEQGWIPGDAIRERVRRTTSADGKAVYTRTIKFGRLGARYELEDRCDAEIFAALWPLTRGARIRKHRHRIPHGAHVWEIDVFLDRTLVVAEIELRSESEPFEVPAWLSRYIVKDVTDDAAYTNSSMATADVPDDVAS